MRQRLKEMNAIGFSQTHSLSKFKYLYRCRTQCLQNITTVAGLMVLAFSSTMFLMFTNDFLPVPSPCSFSCPFLKCAKKSSAGATRPEKR